MTRLAGEKCQEGIPAEHDLDAVVRNFKPGGRGPVLLAGSKRGWWVVKDDCTDVMRALLKYDVAGAGVIIADPASVAALQVLPIGGRMTLAIGGKGSRLDPGPVSLDVELQVAQRWALRASEDMKSQMVVLGMIIEMGPAAVVRHRGLTILLTSKRLAPMDLGQWRSQGIDPEKLSMIGIKAAVGHRRAYDKIASASFTVATAGPCTSDLSRLPYKRLRRPVFPLDAMAD